MKDKILLETYMWGFNDALDGRVRVLGVAHIGRWVSG